MNLAGTARPGWGTCFAEGASAPIAQQREQIVEVNLTISINV